jgi:hypothetical protein
MHTASHEAGRVLKAGHRNRVKIVGEWGCDLLLQTEQ